MCGLKRNGSGYWDPTAYNALKKFDYMPIVYVCSPLRGDIIENTALAQRYCRFVLDHGGIPLAPHLLFPQFMNDENAKERQLAIKMNLVLLDKCEEVWVFGSKISEGMVHEINRAHDKKKRIRRFNQCS